MARSAKNERPVRLNLSLPTELAQWVEEGMRQNVFCQTRQDFIVGKLTVAMMNETKEQGMLEVS